MSKQLWLVIRQTYKTRLKSPGYWLLVLAPVLILAVIAAMGFIITATQSHKTPVVGVVNQPAVTTYLQKDKTADVKVKAVATAAAAAADLRKGKLDGYLQVKNQQFELISSANGESISETKLQTALNNYTVAIKAAALNLNAQQLQALMTPP